MHREFKNEWHNRAADGVNVAKGDLLCRECDTIIPSGDQCYQNGGYACCQWCFSEDKIGKGLPYDQIGYTGKPQNGTYQPPTWRPTKQQQQAGWNARLCTRDDGSHIEWLDRLDLQEGGK
jgi:hypothetical protein